MSTHVKIGAETPRKEYVAGATQTRFPFDFAVFQAADVEVRVNGSRIASGFAVEVAASGRGEVVFAAAPAPGARVTLLRRLTIQRQSDFQEGGELRAKTLNDELDFLAASIQQVAHAGARAVRLPEADPLALDMTLPDRNARANRLLGFDGTGAPAALAPESQPDAAALTNWRVDAFVGDGTTTVFDLAVDPGLKTNLHVYVDGVRQHLGHFELVGRGVAFDAPPPAGSAIEVAYGTVLGSAQISDGQVTDAKVASVSAAKLTGQVALANGGTGAANAAAARTNLGLGTMATQNADAISVTGGTMSNVSVLGGSWVSGTQSIGDASFEIYDDLAQTKRAKFQVAGVTAGHTRTLSVPDRDGTLATLEGNQAFAGNIGFGTGVAPTGGRVQIAQAAGTVNDGLRITQGGGDLRLFTDGANACLQAIGATAHIRHNAYIHRFVSPSGGVLFDVNAFAGTTAPVNWLSAEAGATGANVAWRVAGETNVGVNYFTRGTGGHDFHTGFPLDALQFRVAHRAGAVNFIQATGGSIGTPPTIAAAGTDASVGLNLNLKGGGNLFVNGGALSDLNVVFNAASGGYGSHLYLDSTAISPFAWLFGRAQGTTHWRLGSGGTPNAIQFQTGAGFAEQFRVAHTASATRHVAVTGSTSGNPIVSASGGALTFNSAGATETHGFQHAGNNALWITGNASAVNWLQITNASTGNAVAMSAVGSDANVGIYLSSKGAGNVNLSPGGQATPGFRVEHQANAANFVEVVAGPAATAPRLRVGGADANMTLHIDARGGNPVTLNDLFQFWRGGVNGLAVHGAATGNPVAIGAMGPDADVQLRLYSKGNREILYAGNGHRFFNQSGATNFRATDAGGTIVNNTYFFGATSGNRPVWGVEGSDANVGVSIQTKGSGPVVFATGGGTQLQVNDTAGATRNVTISGSNGGAPVLSTSAGALTIQPAGAVTYFSGAGGGGDGIVNVLQSGNDNAVRISASHSSFGANVLQPWAVRSASSTFDLIECVAGGGSEVPFRVRGDGRTEIGANFPTPAGGSDAMSLRFGTGPGVFMGSGAPAVSAPQGSLYLRTDGSSASTRMYVNTNGSTGWTAVTTAA